MQQIPGILSVCCNTLLYMATSHWLVACPSNPIIWLQIGRQQHHLCVRSNLFYFHNFMRVGIKLMAYTITMPKTLFCALLTDPEMTRCHGKHLPREATPGHSRHARVQRPRQFSILKAQRMSLQGKGGGTGPSHWNMRRLGICGAAPPQT